MFKLVKIGLLIFIINASFLVQPRISKSIIKISPAAIKYHQIESIKRNKDIDLHRINNSLNLFTKFIKQIESLVFDEDTNKEEALLKFLEMHEQILTLFNGDSELEVMLTEMLLKSLKNLIRKGDIQKMKGAKALRPG